MSQSNCGILQLSDCAMMYILSYLDATSLFNLSRTCLYFKNIVEDPQLWRYIDARQEPNSTKKVNYVCERVHDKTLRILLKAESKYEGVLPKENLIGWNQLEKLTVLALENQRFDGRSMSLQDFPKSLEELSLRKTHVKHGNSFFQGSYSKMRNLRVLVLDECEWLDSNFFMSVAKFEKLEILSIVKCMRLHLNVVPYLSVARHGCRKLKLIDCRFNTIANELVSHSHNSLVALYLQSMSSYELDKGTPLTMRTPATLVSRDLIAQNTVKNRSLACYKHLIGGLVEEIPESLLYRDPYPECSCGWKDREEPLSDMDDAVPTTSMEVDDFIDFRLSPQRFICGRHIKELNTLPHDFNFACREKITYPDSSDNDSDSDEDKNCCMFGVGKSQMIVLKFREADELGNIPQPEVIDVFGSSRNVINIDVNVNINQDRNEPSNPDPAPQPSTSRENPAPKRKAEDEGGRETKRPNVNAQGGGDQENQMANEEMPGPSRPEFGSYRAARVHIAGGRSLRINIRGSSSPIRLLQDQLQQRENRKKIKLRRLSLRGYKEITDDVLAFIQNLNLDLLDVTYTKVTKEGISKFLNLNPTCRVIHPNYCVCKPIILC